MNDAYPTPEEAALAGWSGSSAARIVRIEQCTDPTFPGRIWVFVDTEPSHLMRVNCELIEGKWFAVGDMSE
jgi:hypothetical protein